VTDPGAPASAPRALVVRSGAVPAVRFPRPAEPGRLEIVEKLSHTVVPLAADLSALSSDEPAGLAVFTSQIAVRFLLGEPEHARLFHEAIAGGRVAAVGEMTAESLRSFGIQPDIVAAGSGASVLDRLPARLDRMRVLLPRGDDATRELPEGLEARGARLEPIVLYSKKARPRDPDLDRDLEGIGLPFAAFFVSSPSAGHWLFHGATENAVTALRATPAVVLGRFTERYLESHGIDRIETAPEASFASALEALLNLTELAAPRRPA
jgi:uroporphyrinogen III methyltransferase/synthase